MRRVRGPNGRERDGNCKEQELEGRAWARGRRRRRGERSERHVGVERKPREVRQRRAGVGRDRCGNATRATGGHGRIGGGRDRNLARARGWNDQTDDGSERVGHRGDAGLEASHDGRASIDHRSDNRSNRGDDRLRRRFHDRSQHRRDRLHSGSKDLVDHGRRSRIDHAHDGFGPTGRAGDRGTGIGHRTVDGRSRHGYGGCGWERQRVLAGNASGTSGLGALRVRQEENCQDEQCAHAQEHQNPDPPRAARHSMDIPCSPAR